jgi:hypothetical protein
MRYPFFTAAAAIAFAATSAAAQAPSLSQFVTTADARFAQCAATYQRGIAGGNLGFGGTNCTYLAQKEIEPAYRALKAGLAGRPATLSLFNDYYATWTAGLDGMQPGPGEVRMSYSARQAATAQELRRLGARLKLED